MEKLPRCRICLTKNFPMYIMIDKNLRDLYEKLTDVPFVTGDMRPILICFFCCAKLKQSFRLLRKCLEAEELFARMMNEGYELDLLTHPNHVEDFGGFIKSPIVHVCCIDDECQTERIPTKEELPDNCERLNDTVESKEENKSEDLKPGDADNSCPVEEVPPHQSQPDSDSDVPLIELIAEVERVETNSARVTRRTKLNLEETSTAELKKNEQSKLEVLRTTRNRTSKPGTYLEEPDECDQRSLNEVKKLKQLARTQISKKPYNCDVCQRSFRTKTGFVRHAQTHTGAKVCNCNECKSA